MTNGEYRDLVIRQPAAIRRLEELEPGMFEAGVLHATMGERFQPNDLDTPQEAAAYEAGYNAAQEKAS